MTGAQNLISKSVPYPVPDKHTGPTGIELRILGARRPDYTKAY